MTSIVISRITRKNEADKFKAAMEGQSWMNFEVLVCPAGGEFEVIVQTRETDDELEVRRMITLVMFDTINEA